MRGKFNRTIVATDSGKVVPYAMVEVLKQASGDPAVLFGVESGGTAIANPTEASALGLVSFFLDAGRYRFIARSVGGVFISEITHEVVVDPDMASSNTAWQALSGSSAVYPNSLLASNIVVDGIELQHELAREALRLQKYEIVTLSGTAQNLTYDAGLGLALYRFTNVSAKTYTVRPNSTYTVPVGAIFEISNIGGALTIVAGPGVTINAPDSSTKTIVNGWSGRLTCVGVDQYDLHIEYDQAILARANHTGTQPVSTISDFDEAVDEKIAEGVSGKENTIIAGTTSQYLRGDKSWQTLNKSAAGLSNVDNTSDVSKPISTATASALNLKLDKSALKGNLLSPSGLNAASTLAVSNAISSAMAGETPMGSWNASTNTPTLYSSGAGGIAGQFYQVSVAGTTNIDGNAVWYVGDKIIFNGSQWSRIPAGGVRSVNGATGAVNFNHGTINDLRMAPSVTTIATTAGYYTAGDGGAGEYWLDASDTTSVDNGFTVIVAADGGRWKLQAVNGHYSVSQAGENFARAWSASKYLVGTHGHTYEIDELLVSTGVDVSIIAPFSNFVSVGSNGIFYCIGGWLNQQTISSIAGAVFTVPSAAGYLADQIIKIVDDAPLDINPSQGLQGEFAVVSGVSSNNITIRYNPYYTYTTANNAKLAILSRNKIKLDLGEVSFQDRTLTIGGANPATNELITIEAAQGADIKVNYVPWSVYGVINFISCIACHGYISHIESMPVVGGYGIVATNSEGCSYKVALASSGRHLFDAISLTRGTGLSRHGAAVRNTGYDSVARGFLESAFAWHHGTRDNVYKNCSSFKSYGWVAFRGVNNSVIGGISDGDQLPVITQSQDADSSWVTSGSELINPTIIAPVFNAISFRRYGGDLTITGGNIKSLTTTLVSYDATSVDCSCKLTGGVNVSYGATTPVSVVSVSSSTAKEIDLNGVSFKGSSAGLRIVSNTAIAPIIVKLNDLVFDGAITINPVYFETIPTTNLPAAGSRISNIIAPTISSIIYNHINSYAQPICAGPIVSNYIKILDAA